MLALVYSENYITAPQGVICTIQFLTLKSVPFRGAFLFGKSFCWTIQAYGEGWLPSADATVRGDRAENHGQYRLPRCSRHGA